MKQCIWVGSQRLGILLPSFAINWPQDWVTGLSHLWWPDPYHFTFIECIVTITVFMYTAMDGLDVMQKDGFIRAVCGLLFFLLLGISPDYAQPLRCQVTEITALWLASTAWAYFEQEIYIRPTSSGYMMSVIFFSSNDTLLNFVQ